MVVVEIQRRKNFVKHIINTVANPKTKNEYKLAKRKCREYGYDRVYREFGISYQRIAKEMGVCVQKAMRVVKYAIDKCFLAVTHNQKQVYCKGAACFDKYIDKKNYTFCTKDNFYFIYANVYSLGSRLA